MDYRTKAILQGVSGGIIVGIAFLILFITNLELTPEQKFEIVDTYENCKVIRYTDPSHNWHYFLRCPT